jgi:elongation factor P
MRVGILGCGNVGSAVVRMLCDHAADIGRRAGGPIEVAAVAVRDPGRWREVPLDASVFTSDAAAVVRDPSVDIVVEVIGGIEPARTLILVASKSGGTIEPASMETHDLEFMYQGGDTYHFMNTETYDQLEMDEEMLGDNAQWMQPGMKITAEYYNGRPIGIDLPNSMTLEVVDTSAVMKTATKNASSKPAKLENGVTINVPEFIKVGEKVRVNPSTGEYQDRAK